MWIPLLREREKENKIRGKEKVSPKVKTQGRAIGTTILPIRIPGISSHSKRAQMIPKEKGKVRKAKVKVIKVRVVKLPMLSPMLGLKSNILQRLLVTNLNQKSLHCSPWKRPCHLSLRNLSAQMHQSLVLVEVQDELRGRKIGGRQTKGKQWETNARRHPESWTQPARVGDT